MAALEQIHSVKKIQTDRTNNRKTLSKKRPIWLFCCPQTHHLSPPPLNERESERQAFCFVPINYFMTHSQEFKKYFFERKTVSSTRILRQDIHLCTANSLWSFFKKLKQWVWAVQWVHLNQNCFQVTITLYKKLSTFQTSKNIYYLKLS